MHMLLYKQTMYKPNPFLLSTLHVWIEGALQIHRNSHEGHEGYPDPQTIMKLIHRDHPGAIFSPNWFSVQYKRYMDTKRKRQPRQQQSAVTTKTPPDTAAADDGWQPG